MGLRRKLKNFFKKEPEKKKNIINNVYQTNYQKRVLISYIIAPFQVENSFMHQNFATSHIISEAFSALGYDVDVVEYGDTEIDIDYGIYSVIFGFGYHLERSFYDPNRNVFRIHFITGAHELLQNQMSLQSVKDFYEISGLWLPNETKVRQDRTYYTDFESDVAIVLAYGFVFEDYRSRFSRKLYSLNNNILGTFNGLKSKTAESRNSNFLFLSGTKLVVKGLFILLELARFRKDLNFYIIVHYVDEPLASYYQDMLERADNVYLYQNLRMNSEEMKEIIECCSYTVGPSYIDGLPGGIIEPMSAGLIPVVSKYCGFPDKEFIFELDDLSIEGLNRGIDRVLALDDGTYVKMSNAVKEYTQESYSSARVQEQLTEILKAELLSDIVKKNI